MPSESVGESRCGYYTYPRFIRGLYPFIPANPRLLYAVYPLLDMPCARVRVPVYMCILVFDAPAWCINTSREVSAMSTETRYNCLNCTHLHSEADGCQWDREAHSPESFALDGCTCPTSPKPKRSYSVAALVNQDDACGNCGSEPSKRYWRPHWNQVNIDGIDLCDCGGSMARCEGCELRFPNPRHADWYPYAYRHSYIGAKSGELVTFTAGYICCDCDAGNESGCKFDSSGNACCIDATRDGCSCEGCQHNSRCDHCAEPICINQISPAPVLFTCGGGAFTCADCDDCVKRCKSCGACNCCDGRGISGGCEH